MTDDRPREFLQLPDGSYVRVTSTDDGELASIFRVSDVLA
jgi:hypothetical protein